MEIKDYPSASKLAIVLRLADIVQELVGLYDELAVSKVSEHRAKMEAWAESNDSTATGRVQYASYKATSSTLSVIEIESRIRALDEEKWFIQRLIDNGWYEGGN